jgi:hypothetical protein
MKGLYHRILIGMLSLAAYDGVRFLFCHRMVICDRIEPVMEFLRENLPVF